MRNLLIEWAGKGVGHERSVCHSVDVLHQVVKEVAVGTRQQQDKKKTSSNALAIAI